MREREVAAVGASAATRRSSATEGDECGGGTGGREALGLRPHAGCLLQYSPHLGSSSRDLVGAIPDPQQLPGEASQTYEERHEWAV